MTAQICVFYTQFCVAGRLHNGVKDSHTKAALMTWRVLGVWKRVEYLFYLITATIINNFQSNFAFEEINNRVVCAVMELLALQWCAMAFQLTHNPA